MPLKGIFESGNVRIMDLLNDVYLNNRIIGNNQSYDSIVSKPIDWGLVSNALTPYKQASYDYLSLCRI